MYLVSLVAAYINMVCFSLKFRKLFMYGLKAQKLLAQGSALGIMAIGKAPCKVGCSKFV